ncbi:hypothetical protein JCM5296_003376 [Sporobolomyces johnsonii]
MSETAVGGRGEGDSAEGRLGSSPATSDPAPLSSQDSRARTPPPLESPAQSDSSDSDLKSESSTGVQRSARVPPTVSPRKELMRLIRRLPSDSSRADVLAVRSAIKERERLDDSAPVRALISHAFHRSFDDIAVRLLKESASLILARHPDSPPSKAVVLSMFEDASRSLARRRQWASVISVTGAALARGITSPALLHIRMQALSERKRNEDAISTYDLFSEHKLEPDGRVYDEVITAHLRDANLKSAQELLAEKGEKGLRTTVQTCLSLLDGMVLFGGNRIMEEKMLMSPDLEVAPRRIAMSQSVRVLNKIMSVRAARGALRDALAVLNRFRLDAFPADLVQSFHSLVLPLDPANTPSIAPPDPRLAKWQPSPDLATIVILVGIALRQHRPDLAESVISQAYSLELGVNDHLVASIVRTLLAQHDLDAAEAFVFSLPRGEAHFGGHRYPTLEPSSSVYEVLLSGILRVRGLAGANACFRHLSETRQLSLKVTEGMTSALVDHLALDRLEKVGVSADVLVKVQRITQGGTRPTIENLNTLLKAAWASERLTRQEARLSGSSIEAQFPLPEDDDLPPPPNQPVHPPPIATSLPPESELVARPPPSSGYPAPPSSLSRIRDSIADRSIRHDGNTARHILRNDHLVRFISKKWEYFQSQVVDLGIRPTYHHFTALLRAYLLLGDIKGATIALRYALEEAGIEPHVALFSTMISGLARLGQHDAALQTYREMRAAGLEPDRNLFAALAMSCARQRDLAGLERVLDEVRRHVRAKAATPHPQILAQARAQARGSAAFPTTLVTPYDPRLDAVFVAILYRTLCATGRYLEAQEVVRSGLERGLVPDEVLLKVLMRTRKWLRWKGNRAEAGGQEDPVPQREKVVALNAANVGKVRKMLRQMRPQQGKKELRELERYWERAEKGFLEDEEDEDDLEIFAKDVEDELASVV